jgi:hypothetical protein
VVFVKLLKATVSVSLKMRIEISGFKVESSVLHLGSRNAMKQYALPGAYQFAHLPCPR